MTHLSTTFYSASAGSGKTYTLARDYLSLLFQHPGSRAYRQILAVTFTNKAVQEMKERILEYLLEFTRPEPATKVLGIKTHIQELTQLDDRAFRNKAQHIHDRLLHDYSAFDIVTIDAFNHRILRTFSKDIDLPANFEVEMDFKRLVSKAIHQLLSRAGQEPELTKFLVEFSLGKIDEGRSWDIEYDLHDIAELIPKENHFAYLKQLKDKKMEDFVRFRESVQQKIIKARVELEEMAGKIVGQIDQNGLQAEDFFYKADRCYKLIMHSAQGKFDLDPTKGYIAGMADASLYNKSASPEAQDSIEALRPALVELAELYTSNFGQVAFYKNILKHLTPLSLLNELMLEIEKIKEAEQIVPIYEFNALLSEQIRDEPAPFIYERLGERYTHFFIDEFQDTSKLQWSNMQPLIANALQQERDSGQRGSLMLVGDAKQSIYRWRGGDADQFLDLLAGDYLFEMPKLNKSLEANWRSFDQIIEFNNEFFDFYGQHLNHEVYKGLYADFLKQETRNKPGGYIQIDFLDKDQAAIHEIEDEEMDSPYPVHVMRQVEQALASGFNPGDICVLVRTNKQGHAIAQYLVSQHMPVVSGDSLLVHASAKVQLLVHFMRMLQTPDQKAPRFDFLLAYAKVFDVDHLNQFISLYMEQDWRSFCESFPTQEEVLLDSAFAKAPLFQATESVAAALGLFGEPDTRLQAFLEFVFEYSRGYEVSLSGFLEHWGLKQENLSVPASADVDAVQIMTIHKSKGLEFPVVIVPHCDTQIDDIRKAMAWVPVDPNNHEGFENVYIALNKTNLLYPDPAPAVYQQELSKAQMDHINTLYVAFTRAREQLFISAIDKEIKGDSRNYSQLLKQFVEQVSWEEVQHEGWVSIRQGFSQRKSEPSPGDQIQQMEKYEVNIDPERIAISTRKGSLWASGAIESINKGNLLHEYLAKVKYDVNLDQVSSQVNRDTSLLEAERESLIDKMGKVVNHPAIAQFFKAEYTVINEYPILLPNGKRLIPDRLVIKDDQVVIMDYKTGALDDRHKTQVDGYAQQLALMGWRVTGKILVYTDQMEIVKWS
ncbi:UvrD-helicase domain-containing protein [Nonlabens xiamenensis]|uniref:UvrD-helicase domain-containing protein n=1 Tax=Nonlabens xiamenensis TaxID=2341043 RepID=UPI000F60E9D7|nr:UvrD-helicase domain-containing protein [Nonlabens xiamenensis]